MTAELLGLIDCSVNPILTALSKTKVRSNGMTDRERLIDLIKKAEKQELLDFFTADLDEAIDMSGGTQFNGTVEHLTDYLLEHGVIVLPCKVGDTIYQTDGVRIYTSTIYEITYTANKVIFVTENVVFDERAINNSIFLTREEAEKALKERESNA